MLESAAKPNHIEQIAPLHKSNLLRIHKQSPRSLRPRPLPTAFLYNMSLTDIACRVGYGDLRNMERAFKHFVGITPREYKTVLLTNSSLKSKRK
jgi:AraC-like DNA-binding protein